MFVVLVASIREIVRLGVICRPGDADSTIMCVCATPESCIFCVYWYLGLAALLPEHPFLHDVFYIFHLLHSLVGRSHSLSELRVVSNAVGCDVYHCWCSAQQHCHCQGSSRMSACAAFVAVFGVLTCCPYTTHTTRNDTITIQHNTTKYNITRHNTIRNNTVQHSTT